MGLRRVGGLSLGSVVYPGFWLVKTRNRRLDPTPEEARALVEAEIARSSRSRLARSAFRLEGALLRRGARPQTRHPRGARGGAPGMTAYLVTGGAGFIGSHVVRRLAADPDARITVFDNLTSGRPEHLEGLLDDGRVEIVEGDLKDLDAIVVAIRGVDHAFHFAANPDIAKAMAEPSVDFWEGTYLTHNLLEAMRRSGVPRLTYASGSGVYGDVGELPVREDMALRPISPYGASKLACEAMIGTYCYMFGLRALALRFANVVGPNQTHGVAYDFIRRLHAAPRVLEIMGDGTQSKSYVHVDDVVDALLGLFPGDDDAVGIEVLNIATEDYLTVREIADMVVERMGLRDVEYRFGEEARGWKGDVPVVRFDSARARSLGWSNARTTARGHGRRDSRHGPRGEEWGARAWLIAGSPPRAARISTTGRTATPTPSSAPSPFCRGTTTSTCARRPRISSRRLRSA